MHKETVREAALNSHERKIVRFIKIFSLIVNKSLFIIYALVNILRIFAFSLLLSHSNSNNTLFQ